MKNYTPLNLTWWIAAKDRVVTDLARVWYTRWARLRLWSRDVKCGPGLCVQGPLNLLISRKSEMRIGSGVHINSGFRGNAVGGGVRMGIAVLRGARLIIGDGVGMSSSTISCHEEIVIGDQAYIGGGCNIYDSDFHSLLPEERLSSVDTGVRKAPVHIGKRAWIGGHCILLKGVTIGDEAVIGAGSVVTRSVPAGEIWAGNPARFVRKLRRNESAAQAAATQR